MKPESGRVKGLRSGSPLMDEDWVEVIATVDVSFTLE
jgi:hypothetical protein